MGDAMTNYNDGKWHGWNGGDCPVHPETVVEVVHKDMGVLGGRTAGSNLWNSGNQVAFRVIKEYKEPAKPREVWVAFDKVGGVSDAATHQGSLADYGYHEVKRFREVLPD